MLSEDSKLERPFFLLEFNFDYYRFTDDTVRRSAGYQLKTIMKRLPSSNSIPVHVRKKKGGNT